MKNIGKQILVASIATVAVAAAVPAGAGTTGVYNPRNGLLHPRDYPEAKKGPTTNYYLPNYKRRWNTTQEYLPRNRLHKGGIIAPCDAHKPKAKKSRRVSPFARPHKGDDCCN